MYRKIKIFSLGLAFVVLFAVGISVFAFQGPSSNPPIGSGAIDVDSGFNLGIGGSANADTKLRITSDGTNTYGLRVLDSASTPVLVVQSDGKIGVGVSSLGASDPTFKVNGTIGGTFAGTVPAGNVSPGEFNSNLSGAGSGDYTFPGRVGIGIATSPVGKLELGSGQILAAAGTAGAPSYSFTGSGATGIYRKSANTIAIVANGAERLVINNNSANGQILVPGVGTATKPAIEIIPPGATAGGGGIFGPLNGATGYYGLGFTTGVADAAIERMRIDGGTGNVGIGTAAPAYLLDINGPIRTVPTSIIPTGANGVIYYNLTLGKFRCYEGGVWANCISASGVATRVAFFDTANSVSSNANLYWDNVNSRLGVGTASPNAKLQVDDGSVLFGGTTGTLPATGAGTRFVWYPAKAALRAGTAVGSEWDDTRIGTNSIGLGYNTQATGFGSLSLGVNNVASGNNSVVIGSNSNASQTGAMVFGFQTDAGGFSSIGIGTNVTAGTLLAQNYNVVIGKGFDNTNRLVNTIPLSLMVGFDSTIPTLFVGPGAGIGTLGNVGIGTTNPQSLLEVSSGGYFQFSRSFAGAPPATDCDANAERGRLAIDTTNNRLYVCMGATRGWDYGPLTN